jgi:hypothetical protein
MSDKILLVVDDEWIKNLAEWINTYEMFLDARQKITKFVEDNKIEGVDVEDILKSSKDKKKVRFEEKPKEVKKKSIVKEKPKTVKKVEEKPKPSKKKKETKTQCVKVDALRKSSGDKTITLKKWMKDENNVYVGRQGRIFIGKGDDKEIFHYKGSKFANPYKVGIKEGEYSLEESLKLYKKHLKKTGLDKEVEELRGKTLGCFCDQKGPCHAKILAEMLK